MSKLTQPARFRAWILVRLRGLSPDWVAGTWARRWRLAARIYRDRAINTMVGLRMEQEAVRALQQALDEKDDKRPIIGRELDDYITGLRGRVESLWMHSVDLMHERDAARAAFEALRRVSAGRRADHLHTADDPPCEDCARIAAYEETL